MKPEIYDLTHKKVGPLPAAAKIKITRELGYGDETLELEYPKEGIRAEAIKNEAYLRTPKQEYVIKDVDSESNRDTIRLEAALNIEELEGRVWPGGCATVEQTLQACMEFILAGTPWTAEVPPEISKKRTVRNEGDTTTWEMVKAAVDTYRVEVQIDALAKVLKFSERIGQDRGCYFREDLNLQSLGVKSSTYGFATRLIPIGKDGMGLWLDGGKTYIENHQYTDKVITAVWRDERYQNTASLLEDATARLAEMSQPVVAYEAKIEDLASQSDEYRAMEFDLGDTITIYSETTGVRTTQRIVKLEQWPLDPKRDVAELSNARKSFAEIQKEAEDMIKQDSLSVAKHYFKGALEGYSTKEETALAIQTADGEIRTTISKNFSTKAETAEYAATAKKDAEAAVKEAKRLSAAAQSAAVEAAKLNVDEVLKAYSTTIQTQALIDQKADGITLAVSEKYETKATVAQVARGAADAATAAETAAKGYTDETLKAYSTTVETQSLINQKADAITLSVSQSYATKQSVIDAEASAKGHTDAALKSYSTTTEVQSLINQKADGITLEVSKTYATQTEMSEAKQAATAAQSAATSAKDQANNALTVASRGKDYTDNSLTDYTKTIRSKFAMSPESVDISTGRLTFNSNTIKINSTNFVLDEFGNVSAMGTFRSKSADGWETEITSGCVRMYDGNTIALAMYRDKWSNNGGQLTMNKGDETGYYSADGIALYKGSQPKMKLELDREGWTLWSDYSAMLQNRNGEKNGWFTYLVVDGMMFGGWDVHAVWSNDCGEYVLGIGA